MNCYNIVDELCEALEARHTGCEIDVLGDDVRVVRTFSYASKRDLQITTVLRALASPDWRQMLADAQATLVGQVEAYEQMRKLDEARQGVRLGGGARS